MRGRYRVSSHCRLAIRHNGRIGPAREVRFVEGLLTTCGRRASGRLFALQPYHPAAQTTFYMLDGSDDDLVALRTLGYRIEDRRDYDPSEDRLDD